VVPALRKAIWSLRLRLHSGLRQSGKRLAVGAFGVSSAVFAGWFCGCADGVLWRILPRRGGGEPILLCL